jgi:hypothetical protein
MIVWLVENGGDSKGRVMAIFAEEEDAYTFADLLPHQNRARVVARTLFYGQPEYQGYNE